MREFSRLVAGMLFVLFISCMPNIAMAMVDSEAVNWRADNPNVFIPSVYQACLGRAPTQDEMDRAISVKSKIRIFWEVVATQEYKEMFRDLAVDYRVYVHSKWTYTDTGGIERLCNCYYHAEFAMDHLLSGPYTFPIARAVVLMNNAFDMDACPYFDCGFSELGLNPNSPIVPARGNLVVDPNFANFGSPNGPWGKNVLYGHYGIWWNSNYARSSAQKVTFQDDTTALYIENQSGASPHVFGTTAQRIETVPGQRYRVSFLGAAQDLAPSGVYIVVDPEWEIRPINMSGGTYEWTEFSGEFVAQDSYIDLRIIIADRGEVWITQMTLQEVQ